MNPRVSRRLALALGAMLFAGAATAQTSAAPPDKVVWGYTNPSAFYWDVYAAIDLGFMKREGVDVDSININTVGQSAQMLLSSAIDILSLSTEVAISAAEKGGDLVMIGVETNKPTFALLARPDISSYADLRGKTLGVTQMTEASTTMLRLLMKQHGVADNEYDLVPTGGSPTRFAALKSGAVAATMLGQPFDFIAVGEGMKLMGYALEAFDGPLVALTVRRAWVRTHADVATRFLRATADAAKWLHDKSNRDRAIDILNRAAKSSPEESAKSYDLYFGPLDIMSTDLRMTRDGVKKYLDLRGGSGDPASFFDMTYLDRALAH